MFARPILTPPVEARETEGASSAFLRCLVEAVEDPAEFVGLLPRLRRALSGPRPLGRPSLGPQPATGPGRRLKEAYIVATGWAMAEFPFPDGRRQIVRFYLPGDLMGWDAELAEGMQVSAITPVTILDAGPVLALADEFPPLTQALDAVRRAERDRLSRHVLRLGRASARERIADFLLELHDREGRAGLATGDALVFPLSQEILADHLGLSVVHVNRMLQQLRREGLIQYHGCTMTVLDHAGLTSAARLLLCATTRARRRLDSHLRPQDRHPGSTDVGVEFRDAACAPHAHQSLTAQPE